MQVTLLPKLIFEELQRDVEVMCKDIFRRGKLFQGKIAELLKILTSTLEL